MSQQRAQNLQSYYTQHVAKTRLGQMVCKSYSACTESADRRGAEFYEAQGHAVGPCFDLSTEDGVPFRVLVVPMEAGGGETFCSIRHRTDRVLERGGQSIDERNSHMKGVTLALRLAFGLPYKDWRGLPFMEPRDEQVNFTNGRHAHLFECYAMANLLLCSAVADAGSQKSLATSIMRQNCIRHLLATIDILQPTLVISQGWGGLFNTLRKNFAVDRRFREDLADCYLAECHLGDRQFVWVGLWHPTRFWSTINQAYFTETAVRAIKSGRTRALTLAQPV
jgi:hypothetical protein